jgi:predicted transcriptional regulator
MEDKHNSSSKLSRREREIMEILYRRGQATVAEVIEGMEAPPSYSAVRATLRILDDKGQVLHSQDGPRYVYKPTASPAVASRSALRKVIHTFFSGSAGQAASALLVSSDTELGDAELDRLQALIDDARRKREAE